MLKESKLVLAAAILYNNVYLHYFSPNCKYFGFWKKQSVTFLRNKKVLACFWKVKINVSRVGVLFQLDRQSSPGGKWWLYCCLCWWWVKHIPTHTTWSENLQQIYSNALAFFFSSSRSIVCYEISCFSFNCNRWKLCRKGFNWLEAKHSCGNWNQTLLCTRDAQDVNQHRLPESASITLTYVPGSLIIEGKPAFL